MLCFGKRTLDEQDSAGCYHPDNLFAVRIQALHIGY